MNLINRIKKHYEDNWGDFLEYTFPPSEPICNLLSEFRILKFNPTQKRNFWTYATCGMSEHDKTQGLELFIFAPTENDFIIKLLIAVADYHASGSHLGLGHTINFGCPWYYKSRCDHGLISLPYLDGTTLEWLKIENRTIRFLWLIPITVEEVEYKKKNGLDSLENIFESTSFNYIDPYRKSVV